MGCVLTVYSKSAYKKYLLPAVRDANYSIILFKDLFRLSGDVKVELENTSGEWKILPSAAYSLAYTDTRKNAVGQTLRDSDIFSLTMRGGEQVTVIVTISDSFFHVFEKFRLDNNQSVSIGTDEGNDISYVFMHAISKIHAVLRKQKGRCVLEDRSVNGVFVNAERVNSARELEYGDIVDLYGLSLVYLDDALAVDTTVDGITLRRLKPFTPPEEKQLPEAEEGIYVIRRSPRYLPKMADDTITIEPPPELKEKDRQPAILTIGPSLTMALPMVLGMGLSIFASNQTGSSGMLMLASGLVMALGSAILGAFWAVMNMKNAKKQLREDELKRFEVYGEYLISCTNKVQERYQRNTDILRQMYPDAVACSKYDWNTSQLWNRNRNHSDFLQQRLGIGSRPFQVTIDVPAERFSMHSDSMAEKARMVAQTYSKLKDVPVCVDFSHKLIGVVGGPGKKGCYPVVHALTVQTAANNCYTDVKLAYVYSSSTRQTQENWSFTRWLPHVWSEDHRVRYVADSPDEASDVFFEIAKALRMRSEAELREGESFQPHYVLFIEDMSVLEGELITTFLMDDRDLGVTVVLLAESYEDLPNECEYIIENSPSFHGVYEVTDFVEDRLPVAFDNISSVEVERFARRLSRIQINESESGGELPGSLTFFDMYGISKLSQLDVETRWRKNRTYENIKGLLGQKAGGAPCYLDVHEKYHGPHGLIAGTTGSGKSETLQTYMLSLAINYSPDDVGFFVIDYKGGGMANLFSDLPHLIGQISNLSGNQVHRAMVSIKSENLRRQRVFNEHGVNNINNYTRLYKNGEASLPVPHLFIVIDEFAELKREEPEFMKELISVAQVGRSLGVHLILATQKPSGTVDDNIWSNSKFRLCLRVQDQQDSKDMLHRPDAAYITQA
ncbi:MAG: FHA domain-containing protein, partial [Oscillospiraceae bacterium]|nr:FHA domain-containing protein [Oscillospiraceae bacterium]